MGTCTVCANESTRTFDIMYEGGILTFDSFQCAIHRLAPICTHCDCVIIGHVVESEAAIYCCTQCAHSAQAKGLDHVPGQGSVPSVSDAAPRPDATPPL